MNNKCQNQAETTRLIRIDEVLAYLPISKSTWWEGVRTGAFPQPVKLGERITCWRLQDVLDLAERGVGKARRLDRGL